MSKQPEIKVGQMWRRPRDGRTVEIVHVSEPPFPGYQRDIHWRGVGKRGSGAIYEDKFLKKYELVEE